MKGGLLYLAVRSTTAVGLVQALPALAYNGNSGSSNNRISLEAQAHVTKCVAGRSPGFYKVSKTGLPAPRRHREGTVFVCWVLSRLEPQAGEAPGAAVLEQLLAGRGPLPSRVKTLQVRGCCGGRAEG